MLSTIAAYWFVSLPGVVTGVVLLKMFKQAHDLKQSKKLVRATAKKR